MSACADVVENGAVRLVATDFGGDGPPLLLTPGLGMTRQSLAGVVSHLQGWRVITMDARGHGESTTGPWSFAAAVADVDAVVRHYALEAPWVGGHSLGGMVALQYALAGRPVSGVVNIDGWGPGVPSRFPGADEDLVNRHLDLVDGGLPLLARFLSSRTRQGREGTTSSVLGELRGADVVAWHRDAPCPSLAFNAVAPPKRVQSLLMGRGSAELQAAYRRGLRRDLAALALEQPRVQVAEVDASHMLIRTHPDAVASAIDAFRAHVTA